VAYITFGNGKKLQKEKNGTKEGNRKSIKKETTQYFRSRIDSDKTGK